MDIYARVKRLEEMLEELMNRLNDIEEKLETLGIEQPTLSIASKLVIAFSMPAIRALEASRRAIAAISKLSAIDPINEAIIEVLSGCEALSISEITRRVKVLRGSASRRIIRERLKKLETLDIVINIGSNDRPKYMLSECIQ
ncbi:MAG: hypothetical protein DRO40_00530 [Thermoprotei archaeon]|nr:MAG: hypothetical protein DRO40_00530 [Thermoprotei archaeon]